jgi:hypothetical protein
MTHCRVKAPDLGDLARLQFASARTAYDIAGHNKAEDGSMINAIRLAQRMLTPSPTSHNPA